MLEGDALAVRLLQRADGMLDPGERVYMEAVLPLLRQEMGAPRSEVEAGLQGLIDYAKNLIFAAGAEGVPDEWGYAVLLADVVRLYGKTCLLVPPS